MQVDKGLVSREKAKIGGKGKPYDGGKRRLGEDQRGAQGTRKDMEEEQDKESIGDELVDSPVFERAV
jgi:hypothetical protein